MVHPTTKNLELKNMNTDIPLQISAARNLCRPLLFLGIAILSSGVLLRMFCATHYGPVIAGDSFSYLSLAEMMRTHDFTGYTAWRTPGYPCFLNLFRCSPPTVVAAQNTLGILNALLVASLFWHATHKPMYTSLLLAFLLLSWNLLFMDEYILTESLATFLFTLTTVWLIVDANSLRRHPLVVASLGGLTVAVLTLTRPQYIALIPAMVFAAILAGLFSCHRRPGLLRLVLFMTTALAPVFGLMAFNKALVGRFTLSTTGDYNLIHHTIPFIEAAEKVDTGNYIPLLVRVREEASEIVVQTGGNRSFIKIPLVDVIPAEAYHDLSVEAIKRCPGRYLVSVLDSWTRFWRIALVYDPDNARSSALVSAVRCSWPLQKAVWLLCNLLFLASACLVPLTLFKRRTVGWFEIAAIAIVAVSVLQALVEYADNSRFAIPMQPFIALMSLYSITVVDSSRFTLASLAKALCKHAPANTTAP